ncbi:von Willebrand factor A domain-containing protein 1 isoform X2 [Syngnathus scovelli]|uniref:von Willebrand factor A domain-containing protein 1 isoform X2 n=1 Tax=Syngnathus scovelli TaxID=161590 RepID=UPI0021103CF4|nr:von Willebrand factor A domain-containing protein 1 isoform X2 [Syngnathus scovelli]
MNHARNDRGQRQPCLLHVGAARRRVLTPLNDDATSWMNTRGRGGETEEDDEGDSAHCYNASTNIEEKSYAKCNHLMRMKTFLPGCVFLWAVLQRGSLQVVGLPDSVSNCCEGDILILLDSSGSIANYEFARMLDFTAKLLRPFSLGRGHVRIGLLQVGTKPNLEFGLDEHTNQYNLQKALLSITHLQGNTNTEMALRVAQRLLTNTDVPKVLLWLTDGVELGEVDEPMAQLKAQGVSVLIVSSVHGNFHVLQRAVSPPLESHLYSVDIENIDVITEKLREAIIRIIRAERLRAVDVTSHSAVLQWRPVLSALSGYYELWYKAVGKTHAEERRVIPGESSSMELTKLQPETTYSAFLRPESNKRLFNTLTVTFTTLAGVLSPAVVSVHDSGSGKTQVSWGPLQPALVRGYRVEYGAIPSGTVHTVIVQSHQNFTVLTELEPGIEYLVTVSALYKNGKERAMSVKACSQEAPAPAALPALDDLQLTTAKHDEVQVEWKARQQGLRGFWLSWEKGNTYDSTSTFLPSSSHSTLLTHVAPTSRVCVSPIYSSGRGDGLCCTTEK